MTEVWKPVVGLESRYEVSNLGRVRSIPRIKQGRNMHGSFSFITKSRQMKLIANSQGYIQVTLRADGGEDITARVHRLVAKAFLQYDPDRDQVNHKDSDRANNSAVNLEWVTAQENIQHSYDCGSNSNALELHPRAVLSLETVLLIRAKKAAGIKVSVIAREMGFNYWTVSKVVHNKNWKEVR